MKQFLTTTTRCRAISFDNCGLEGVVHPGKYSTEPSKQLYKCFDRPFDPVEGIHIIVLHNVLAMQERPYVPVRRILYDTD